MSKLLPIEESGQIVGYLFDCPGCGNSHAPYIRPFKNDKGASWTFNGDMNKPTFQPSILAKVERTDGSKIMVCHSFVTDGRIQFLSDCTHELAGRTVDLPEQ
ncbi:DUF6527 family protein [Aulosira sp. FACHB-615]|uniref:DUF6527 family protein n=1 Tax=Aulosira sp. FACHB-615 TaxID=2692777 RepID=UPI0016835470|nr:DUF6527 family protein [Aulosira sp. FACHB-615]MBD2489029.1 hypothetical protein [Aulosira sp. FACHB-615]